MKKFLKIFIYFFIPIVIASACLEVYMRHIPNSYKYKDEWMKKNGNTVETLILGSSYAFYGINPEYLSSKAFNLANVSQDLVRDLFVLEKYKDYEKSLKNVILVLSDANMLQTMEKGVEPWRIAYYHMYMDYPRDYFALEVTNARMADKLETYLRGEDMRGCTLLGFGTAYNISKKQKITKLEIENALARNTVLTKYGEIDTTFLSKNLRAFDDIALFCNHNNIKLIVLTLPVVKGYWSNLNKEQSGLFYHIILTKKKNGEIWFYDYLKDPRFSDEDFFDCDHLNNKGAEKFTRIINKEVLIYSSDTNAIIKK